jgi:hypothetical protein
MLRPRMDGQDNGAGGIAAAGPVETRRIDAAQL